MHCNIRYTCFEQFLYTANDVIQEKSCALVILQEFFVFNDEHTRFVSISVFNVLFYNEQFVNVNIVTERTTLNNNRGLHAICKCNSLNDMR